MTPTNVKKKILFVTGTRADFGKVKPLIQEVKDSAEFEYQIFATGMHMLSLYGLTVNEIKKAKFTKIYSFVNQDPEMMNQMDMVLANSIQGLGVYVREYQPDLIVVHGDRVEAMAGAIVGSLNNILVAHIEGGELSGTIDELIRHSITKLSHLHFVSNEEARKRLIQMGENPGSIFSIGSPDIDIMLSDSLPDLKKVKQKYRIPFESYGIFTYHPVTTELDKLEENITQAVRALLSVDMNMVVIFPNNDTGANIIVQNLKLLENNPRFRIIPSMRFEYFLTLLKYATVVIGNSSVGIREAPVYGVPTVNIGTRQANRFSYPSILNVPDETSRIVDAIHHLPVFNKPSLHFGKGESAKLFIRQLRTAELWQTSRQKQFNDMVVVDSLIVDSVPKSGLETI